MLRRTLPATRFEQLAIPLTIVTTDLQSGSACYWSGQGDLIEPLIASMSLPGIFPPSN
jgi:NTE family protein